MKKMIALIALAFFGMTATCGLSLAAPAENPAPEAPAMHEQQTMEPAMHQQKKQDNVKHEKKAPQQSKKHEKKAEKKHEKPAMQKDAPCAPEAPKN